MADLDIITTKLERIEADIKEIKDKLESKYVTQDQFGPIERGYVTRDQFIPVRNITFGLVGTILLATITGILRVLWKM